MCEPSLPLTSDLECPFEALPEEVCSKGCGNNPSFCAFSPGDQTSPTGPCEFML